MGATATLAGGAQPFRARGPSKAVDTYYMARQRSASRSASPSPPATEESFEAAVAKEVPAALRFLSDSPLQDAWRHFKGTGDASESEANANQRVRSLTVFLQGAGYPADKVQRMLTIEGEMLILAFCTKQVMTTMRRGWTLQIGHGKRL